MQKFIQRFGREVPADAAFTAWTSADVSQMRAALKVRTNAVDRHHLLQTLANALYRKRGFDNFRAEFIEVASLHLSEMATLLTGLEIDDEQGRKAREAAFKERAERRGQRYVTPKAVRYSPPFVSTFEQLARTHLEDGDFAAAAAVWQRAFDVDYIDKKGLRACLKSIDTKREKMAKSKAAKEVEE